MTGRERAGGLAIFHLAMSGDARMKTLLPTLLFLAVSGTAFAMPEPVADPRPAASARADLDADFNIGPAGATLERNYFQAPRPFNAGALPCRFEPSMLAKVHLAQSCR
jgi:hypothetical protein